MKSDIQKACTKKLILAIALSIGFVVGIPLIIVGAMKMKLLMVLGIVLIVLGFYGAPMAWVSFGNLVSEKSVYFAIVEDNLLSTNDIAGNLGTKPEDIKQKINHLLQNRYLTGYKLEEDGKITKLKNQKTETKEIKLKKCPNCGANLTETKDHKYNCKYCGTSFDK